MSKIVIALGGNALQTKNSPLTAEAQLNVIKKTSEYIAEISERGHELAIVHGNGPQIGLMMLAGEAAKDVVSPMPFDVCSAMSQGYIGYQLQQTLKYALNRRNLNYPVVTITTQMIVEKSDPAFLIPSKPIGPFYSELEAKVISNEKGYIMKEEPGKGWRRVVASPLPRNIVEIDVVRRLWNDSIVITCGGGGIPVTQNADGTMEGIAAVIDKDFAAELLAEEVNADLLMILTEVDKVSINFNKPNQENLSSLSLKQAAKFSEEGHFTSGSMLPKVQAAMKFIRANPEKKVLITSLDRAVDALDGKAGTTVTFA